MNCVNCFKELEKHRTFYCSQECKKAYRKRHRAANKRADALLSAGITGRGVFSSSGNKE